MNSGCDAKWSDSLGVEITVQQIYTAPNRWGRGDPGPCPIRVEYEDGNNSKTGAYPRKARLFNETDRPLVFVSAVSAHLAGVYDEEYITICGDGGSFPRYLELVVEQCPCAVTFEEGSKEEEPTDWERWLCQRQLGSDMTYEQFLAAQQISPFLSSQATGAVYDAGNLNFYHATLPRAKPPAPAPAPAPAPTPSPNIFELGKQPRKLEGDPNVP